MQLGYLRVFKADGSQVLSDRHAARLPARLQGRRQPGSTCSAMRCSPTGSRPDSSTRTSLRASATTGPGSPPASRRCARAMSWWPGSFSIRASSSSASHSLSRSVLRSFNLSAGVTLLFAVGAWPSHDGIRGRGGYISTTTSTAGAAGQLPERTRLALRPCGTPRHLERRGLGATTSYLVAVMRSLVPPCPSGMSCRPTTSDEG